MKTSIYKFLVLAGFLVFAASCKDNDSIEPEPTPEEPEFVQVSQYIKKYKNGVVEVSYFPVDTTRSNAQMRDYFCLDSMKFMSATQYLKTKKWDIMFRQRYSSAVYSNYSKTVNVSDPWYDPSLDNDVSFTYVSENFDNVAAVTDNMQFAHGPNPLTQNAVITGTSGADNLSNAQNYQTYLNTGTWAYLSFQSETGAILYSTPYPDLTFLLKLHDGRYAKFQFINNYNTKPTENNASSKRGFLSFRYYVAPAGSKNLNTK